MEGPVTFNLRQGEDATYPLDEGFIEVQNYLEVAVEVELLQAGSTTYVVLHRTKEQGG